MSPTYRIAFKDFVPEVTGQRQVLFLTANEYEALDEVMKRVNAWITNNEIEAVNVETVVVPNIHSSGEEGSTDSQLRTSGDMSSSWYQVIRVWYRLSSTEPPPLP